MISQNTFAAYAAGRARRHDYFEAIAQRPDDAPAFDFYREAAAEDAFTPCVAASVAFVAGVQYRDFPLDDERVHEEASS